MLGELFVYKLMNRPVRRQGGDVSFLLAIPIIGCRLQFLGVEISRRVVDLFFSCLESLDERLFYVMMLGDEIVEEFVVRHPRVMGGWMARILNAHVVFVDDDFTGW